MGSFDFAMIAAAAATETQGTTREYRYVYEYEYRYVHEPGTMTFIFACGEGTCNHAADTLSWKHNMMPTKVGANLGMEYASKSAERCGIAANLWHHSESALTYHLLSIGVNKF
jgi:hypothetical protein